MVRIVEDGHPEYTSRSYSLRHNSPNTLVF